MASSNEKPPVDAEKVAVTHPSTVLQSPCFVHSYLDHGLGNYRHQNVNNGGNKSNSNVSPDSYFEAQQFQSIPAAAYHSLDGAAGESSKTNEINLQDQQNFKNHQRRASSRPQPAHRGMRGAVEPESDDGGNDGSSYSSTSSNSFDQFSSDEDEEEESRVRSLTRQLAETAVGVREMSKQLGRARVKSTIQSVMIITKARDNHLIKLTRELAIWLMTSPRNGRNSGLTVYVDSQLRQSKRFDAEGIRRDYPQIFTRSPTNGQTDVEASSMEMVQTGSSQSNVAGATKSSASSTSGHAREESLLRYWTSDMCSRSPHLFDFVVTLGGDGTVLFCSWLFQRIVPPVMPFALGSLGFLTNFDFKDYQKDLESALDSGIRVNLRMRFTATVYRATLPSADSKFEKQRRRAIKSGKTGEIIMKSIQQDGWDSIEAENGEKFDSNDSQTFNNRTAPKKSKRDKEVMCFSTKPVETFEVLNDLVVDRGPSPYVSLLEVFGDEHHLTTAQADGLCISTPTGSTAYSLSAGGSLVHPEIPAILISPICPHTLSFRPMLLPDSMELRIAVPYNSRSTAWASFDGRGRVELKQGDHIKVSASKYPFPTICADNQSTDWFESISRTLKWNERQRQKSFVVVEERGENEDDENATQEKTKKKKSKRKQQNEDKDAEIALKKKGNEGEEEEGEEEEDDDEEDEEEEGIDDEFAETFDIDDTSTVATRTSSPDPVSRPSSAGVSGRNHHHHHHHHRKQSSGNGEISYSSSSNNNSGTSLPLFGLKPMTSMNSSIISPISPKESLKFNDKTRRGSNGTKVSFDNEIQKGKNNDSKIYQHGIIQPSQRSLLDSPDRFGIAGPPDPPRALSERHLATADFRLDNDDDNDNGDSTTTFTKNENSNEKNQSNQQNDLKDSIINAGENKTKISSGSNKLFKKIKKRSKKHKEDSNNELIEITKSNSRNSTGNNNSGGAALVVYGQDESDDSDSTEDGGGGGGNSSNRVGSSNRGGNNRC